MNACSGQADRSRDEDEKALCSLLPIPPPPLMQEKYMENLEALEMDASLDSHLSMSRPVRIIFLTKSPHVKPALLTSGVLKSLVGALSTLPSCGIEPDYSRTIMTFWDRALGKAVGQREGFLPCNFQCPCSLLP